jgi:hypothetical protein
VAILDGRDLSTCRGFAGYLADRSICTSLVELDETHRRLWIRLASVTRFSVALDRSATGHLIDTLTGADNDADTRNGAVVGPVPGSVPCEHELGSWVLGAGPAPEPAVVPHSERRFGPRPTRLHLRVGEDARDRIEVTLPGRATDALVAHLRACLATMSDE